MTAARLPEYSGAAPSILIMLAGTAKASRPDHTLRPLLLSQVLGLEHQLCASVEREARMAGELDAVAAEHNLVLAARHADLSRLRRSLEEMRLHGDEREERLRRAGAMLREERAAAAEERAAAATAQGENNAAQLAQLAHVQGELAAALARVLKVEAEMEAQRLAAQAELTKERARGAASSAAALFELQTLEHEAADNASERQRHELQTVALQQSLREAQQASRFFTKSVPAPVRERLNQLVDNLLPPLPPSEPSADLLDWRRTSSVDEILAVRRLSVKGAALLEDGVKASIRKMFQFVAVGDNPGDQATIGSRGASASAGRAAARAPTDNTAAGEMAGSDIGYSGRGGADGHNTATVRSDAALATDDRSDETPSALSGDVERNASVDVDGAPPTGPTEGSAGMSRDSCGDAVSACSATGEDTGAAVHATTVSVAAAGAASKAGSSAGSEVGLGTSSGGASGTVGSRASFNVGSRSGASMGSKPKRGHSGRVFFARETEKLVNDVTSVTMTELDGADSVDNIAIQLNAYHAIAKLLEEEVARLRAEVEAAAETEARHKRAEAALKVALRFKRRGEPHMLPPLTLVPSPLPILTHPPACVTCCFACAPRSQASKVKPLRFRRKRLSRPILCTAWTRSITRFVPRCRRRSRRPTKRGCLSPRPSTWRTRRRPTPTPFRS